MSAALIGAEKRSHSLLKQFETIHEDDGDFYSAWCELMLFCVRDHFQGRHRRGTKDGIRHAIPQFEAHARALGFAISDKPEEIHENTLASEPDHIAELLVKGAPRLLTSERPWGKEALVVEMPSTRPRTRATKRAAKGDRALIRKRLRAQQRININQCGREKSGGDWIGGLVLPNILVDMTDPEEYVSELGFAVATTACFFETTRFGDDQTCQDALYEELRRRVPVTRHRHECRKEVWERLVEETKFSEISRRIDELIQSSAVSHPTGVVSSILNEFHVWRVSDTDPMAVDAQTKSPISMDDDGMSTIPSQPPQTPHIVGGPSADLDFKGTKLAAEIGVLAKTKSSLEGDIRRLKVVKVKAQWDVKALSQRVAELNQQYVQAAPSSTPENARKRRRLSSPDRHT
ncbi:Hypothetical protein D9617_51g089070 [Elsinoe fawcettii]|nr:Hypothetical protein D9617_51g089070 [Elsinoe fawcettii]